MFADSPTTDIRDYFPKNKEQFVRNLKLLILIRIEKWCNRLLHHFQFGSPKFVE